MPIQAPQWTDYLNCPVCCREFGPPPRSPISLGCGHTLCRNCLKHLHRKQCPFDQTVLQVDFEELVVNTALLQLAGYTPPPQPYHPPCIQALPEHDRRAYDVVVKCLEQLAVFLKYCSNANNNMSGNRLSRPMQRKIVTLLQCGLTDEEGRGKAARAARSLGERTVTELILQHQNPQQLSANLWAAVRARGCQFLGPAMQEEVLKLVLLALEDGSALSRKVLVMFVVQRLEPHFPQASKTSIGHVVQLLYRASCFKVSKRESDSSLMQLKEEFRSYESLRREHDAQIVQIANEAGLRIAPDQWSSLLYGDTAHKSHMQSIIDKLQTPQSFAQSVQELFIAQQRTGDPAHLVVMSMHLDRLASIDASPEAASPSWQHLAETLTSLAEVVTGLMYKNNMDNASQANQNPNHTMICRDANSRKFCPRGDACTFAHVEDEAERNGVGKANSPTYASVVGRVPGPGVPSFNHRPPMDNYNQVRMPMTANFDVRTTNGPVPRNYRPGPPELVPPPELAQMPLDLPPLLPMPPHYQQRMYHHLDPEQMQYHYGQPNPHMGNTQFVPTLPPGFPYPLPGMAPHGLYIVKTDFINNMPHSTEHNGNVAPMPEPVWPPLNDNTFRFNEMLDALPNTPAANDISFTAPPNPRNSYDIYTAAEQYADECVLEQEMKDLEHRLNSEFKTTD